MSRCMVCRKSMLSCRCHSGAGRPTRHKRSDKSAKTNVDARGNEWCRACNCLVRGGKCVNVTCSTNKG